MRKVIGCCLLPLALCSCSLLAKGDSSGKIGFDGYEVLIWEEAHDIDLKATSPLGKKVLGLLVSEEP